LNDITLAAVNSPANQQLALEAAQQAIVLLKNIPSTAASASAAAGNATNKGRPLLPYPSDLMSMALVGPHADATRAMLGNYHGHPPFIIR
jgi:beta-glucosidase-like glycosyl hydrolase